MLFRQVCLMVKHSREKTKKYLYEIGYEVSCYWFINQYTKYEASVLLLLLLFLFSCCLSLHFF